MGRHWTPAASTSWAEGSHSCPTGVQRAGAGWAFAPTHFLQHEASVLDTVPATLTSSWLLSSHLL